MIGTGADSICVTLCSLKHEREQLQESVELQASQAGVTSYYGSAQVGHLYFFGSELHTPQIASAMLNQRFESGSIIEVNVNDNSQSEGEMSALQSKRNASSLFPK